MKATSLHWALFFGLLVVGVAAGFILGDQYLTKKEERLAQRAANTEQTTG